MRSRIIRKAAVRDEFAARASWLSPALRSSCRVAFAIIASTFFPYSTAHVDGLKVLIDRATKRPPCTRPRRPSCFQRVPASDHDHLRADPHAAVEVGDILVAHADAARRHLRADGPGF